MGRFRARLNDFAGLFLVMLVAVLAGCANAGTATTPNSSALNEHAGARSANSTFTFQTIDDANGKDNRITAIKAHGAIVGVYGNMPFYHSYISSPPKYRHLIPADYPGAVGTYLASITGTGKNAKEGGFVVSPPAQHGIKCTTCGAFLQAGSWTLLQNKSEGTGKCAVTKVLGVTTTGFASGYSLVNDGARCGSIAFEEYATPSKGETFTSFTPPNGINPVAAGMNVWGNVVGSAAFPNGSENIVEGWYYIDGTYVILSFTPSLKTELLGINRHNEIVGSYMDVGRETHGFLLTNPTAKNPVWQAIDEPESHGLTVVSGISDDDAIAGWYRGGDGHLHGFVGMPQRK